jgi:hypothetical protein
VDREHNNLSLIKVSVHRAEYWDSHRMETLQIGGVPVKASMLGHDEEQTEHEEIQFSSQSYSTRQ